MNSASQIVIHFIFLYSLSITLMGIHILGIRHHGPGSARNVKAFLETLKPDIVLVEGPPEADTILQWALNTGLQPPVAILAYQSDDVQRSLFYPFAEFSPEWQAIQYAKKNNIHVRFMDLPLTHYFAMKQEESEKTGEVSTNLETQEGDEKLPDLSPIQSSSTELEDELMVEVLADPISHLANAAGFTDGEKWWEHTFENRIENDGVFTAVTEAMTALRETLPQKKDRREELREAWMRKTIRQAEKEMFQTIAVVCGAWHAPALGNMPKAKDDNELLKGLPKVKVECTWIPWTYNRLSFYSGYGAGILSPGWYEHIWKYPEDDGTMWMAKVAKLFRQQQMDTSVAHVIEAVRLAGALASLRHLSRAGLEELNEATLSVLCNGETLLLQLIHDELIVSNKIGTVPLEIPKPPLQLDIEKQQKKLRLPPTANWKDYMLDLRKENDLERSVFLHRLLLLQIKWAYKSEVSGKGTFKEQWRLQWDPALIIDIIDKGTWGNTTAEAASAFIIHLAKEANSLQDICSLLENCIPAELPEAVEVLILQINNMSAASGDVIQLMEVIPPLVNVSRYGNVRKTDADMVTGIVTGMVTRICVGLPNACTALADDAAEHLLDLFFTMNDAVNLLQQQEVTEQWQHTLQLISSNGNINAVIAGYATRLLSDYKLLAGEALVTAFSFAMSNTPAISASWLEGFLKGSGTLLLIDDELWAVVNNWVSLLDPDTFTQVLPLLRRTFANFTSPERRKLGEKAKQKDMGATPKIQIANNFDFERAAMGIPVVMQLLGFKNSQPDN
jgi:Family of unknown function (DUF5682)